MYPAAITESAHNALTRQWTKVLSLNDLDTLVHITKSILRP